MQLECRTTWAPTATTASPHPFCKMWVRIRRKIIWNWNLTGQIAQFLLFMCFEGNRWCPEGSVRQEQHLRIVQNGHIWSAAIPELCGMHTEGGIFVIFLPNFILRIRTFWYLNFGHLTRLFRRWRMRKLRNTKPWSLFDDTKQHRKIRVQGPTPNTNTSESADGWKTRLLAEFGLFLIHFYKNIFRINPFSSNSLFINTFLHIFISAIPVYSMEEPLCVGWHVTFCNQFMGE